MDWRERTAAITGAALLVLVGVLTALRVGEDEETAYATGAAFGVVVAGLAVAALLRWAYVRVRGEGEVTSGWLLPVAAVVSVVWSVGGAVRDEDPATVAGTGAALDRSAEDCETAEPAPTRDGDGFRFRPLPAGRARDFLGAAPPEVPVERMVVRDVTRDGRPLGVVALVPGLTADADRAGFLAGARDGAAASGATVEATTVAGEEVVTAVLPGGVPAYFGFSGCYAFFAYGLDRGAALAIAERVIVG